jgi:pectinesterase
VLAAKPAYVILQFGHNDCPGKGPERETDPATTFRANMTRYLDDVRAAGAVPVLATSIVRRNFTPEGQIKPDCLVPFVEEVRRLAAEKQVPLLDLYDVTRGQSEALGPAAAHSLLNAAPIDGKPDTTHLGPTSQTAVGLLAARALARAVPTLIPYLLLP